ncbi:MAG: isochorismate synthase [Candidatus Zixiibacteriota bacterium]
MSSIPSLTNTRALAELIASQKNRIHDKGADITGRLFCIQFPLDSFDLLGWLKALPDQQRVYWSNRERTHQVAGIGNILPPGYFGATSLPDQLDRIHRMLQDSSDLLCAHIAGAFSEDPYRDDVWNQFPSLSIVIPELSVVRHEDSSVALITVLLNEDSTAESHLPRMLELVKLLQQSHTVENSKIRFLDRRDYPGANEWNPAVIAATNAIAAGRIDKVVLARRTDFSLDADTDPIDLLAGLSKSNPHCYQILFAPSNNAAFLSVSPERLFRCSGQLLSTEAVAGTVSRGESEIEDLALENRLRNSAKDRAEQEFVVDGITKSLEPLSENIEVSAAASVMKLSRVQHLISEFRSILKPTTSLGNVYAALHPTAAVCGTPRAEAMKLLQESEKFDRGWYAGGIGIVSANQAEFAVGIRSAVLRNDKLSLFTGAGIVRQSIPNEEWLEIEKKLHSIIDLIDGTAL